MRIYKEIELRDFEAWSGAEDTMETLRKLDNVVGGDVFSVLEDCLVNDGIDYDETELNDFLWFETDTIADWLDYDSWEALERFANENKKEIKYKIGDFIIMINGIESEIIEVDISDTIYPYYVKYFNENNEIEEEWIKIDEIEE